MFEFRHTRKRMYKTSWAFSCWLFFMLCFTSESLVTLSNPANNVTNSPSTDATEDTSTDASFLSVEPTTADTTYWGHKLPCTEEERQRVGCLQGKCFAVDLNPRKAGCVCKSGWVGERCELKELPPEFWEASSLVALVVGLVAGVAIVAISLVIFYIKRRQNRQRSFEPNNDQDLPSYRNSTGEEEGTTVPLKKTTDDGSDEQKSSI